MGRSATLCGGKDGHIKPLDWQAIRDHRQLINAKLLDYLQAEPCAVGKPRSMTKSDFYLAELTKAYRSILLDELSDLGDTHNYASTLSFAAIYTELWRQATLLGELLPKSSVEDVRWPTVADEDKEMLDIRDLQNLNHRLEDWKGGELETTYFASFAHNLSASYLKAYGEMGAAIAAQDGRLVKHHMAILGDIFEEMLVLHATLMPRKNSRFGSPSGRTP